MTWVTFPVAGIGNPLSAYLYRNSATQGRKIVLILHEAASNPLAVVSRDRRKRSTAFLHPRRGLKSVRDARLNLNFHRVLDFEQLLHRLPRPVHLRIAHFPITVH